MCKEITVKEAIKQLSRYDNEFYTPANRMAHRMAIAAIKKQEERSNQKPLTIEELHNMYFEPVWIETTGGKSFWMFVYADRVMNRAGYLEYRNYGKEWLAYRHNVRS